MMSEGWRVIDEYLHLGSSTEHCLQSLHDMRSFTSAGKGVFWGREKGGERTELRREEKKRRRERGEGREGRGERENRVPLMLRNLLHHLR